MVERLSEEPDTRRERGAVRVLAGFEGGFR